jgi:hypothetical protein
LVVVFAQYLEALSDVGQRDVVLELLQLHVEIDAFKIAAALYAYEA